MPTPSKIGADSSGTGVGLHLKFDTAQTSLVADPTRGAATRYSVAHVP